MISLASNVTVIPAKKTIGTQKTTDKVQKTRVAAYCRVSTDSDEQETSYETQIEHYTSFINSHPDWVLAGIYADDGISGMNTKKRDEFQRMINDCNEGKIDMVITKSISRFARNTVDCLNYTRALKNKNIGVYFEKENINTLDAKGEVLMTIMHSKKVSHYRLTFVWVCSSDTNKEKFRSITTGSWDIPKMQTGTSSLIQSKLKSLSASIESTLAVRASYR